MARGAAVRAGDRLAGARGREGLGVGLGQPARDRAPSPRRWCSGRSSCGAARWHRSPIIDLGLLRNRTFSAANGMTIVAAAGFYGYTLANVLFLTGVWRYSALQAGLALTPGPFVAAAVAGPTSRIAQRIGPRPVLVAGGLIWGGAVMWLVERVGVQPDFLGEWLPGIVLLGIGAGTLFPNLSGVAVASAPGESFATATGLNSVARQVGAALGRGRDRGDHRHALAAAGAARVRRRLALRGRLPVRRRHRMPAGRAGPHRGALARGGRAAGAAHALASEPLPPAAPARPASDPGRRRAARQARPHRSSRRSSSPALPCSPSSSRGCSSNWRSARGRCGWTPASGCSAKATLAMRCTWCGPGGYRSWTRNRTWWCASSDAATRSVNWRC